MVELRRQPPRIFCKLFEGVFVCPSKNGIRIQPKSIRYLAHSEGEEDYRYLVATDLTWRTLDIVQAYTFRWLIEVFFADWKAHEGWGALTKQPGEEGSSRSLILSLLVDHCLLLHPDQLAQIENKQPAYTVGSLSNRVKVDSLLTIIRELVTADNPVEQLQRLAQQLEEWFPLNSSDKHMVNRDMGRLEPTPSLKYKAIA